MKKYEQGLRDVYNHIKCTNIYTKGVPEEEERKKEQKKIQINNG